MTRGIYLMLRFIVLFLLAIASGVVFADVGIYVNQVRFWVLMPGFLFFFAMIIHLTLDRWVKNRYGIKVPSRRR